MKLESFDGVLDSINKNKSRTFNLLLGNGFSGDYAPSIFSYNALHDFVKKLNDKDLSTILGVIETCNIEVIMQYLDHFTTLIGALGGDPALMSPLEVASEKLKTSLLDAVMVLHPEHVFKVPETRARHAQRSPNALSQVVGTSFRPTTTRCCIGF